MLIDDATRILEGSAQVETETHARLGKRCMVTVDGVRVSYAEGAGR